jgi:hypothetical protein
VALEVAEKLYAPAVFSVQKPDQAYPMEQLLRLAVRKIKAGKIHPGKHHLSDYSLT